MDNLTSQILSLKSKDIWVFGGAGYLGQATVLLLRAAGARVLCIDLDTKAQEFVETANLSPEVIPHTWNAEGEDAIRQFVAEQVKVYGVPHGYVNLTAASTAKAMEDLTEKDFDDVNHRALTATFLLNREVGTYMAKEGRGSLVLFSSMYGMVSPDPKAYKLPMNKNPIEYGINKAGIIQMTRYLAVHWGLQNVRCNCISPGPFPNPGVQRDHPEFIERLALKSPMGRIGRSEEISGAVAFLLSDAASYITGQNLPVDGGWTSW